VALRREKKKLSPSDLQAAGISRELVVRKVRGRSEMSRQHDNPDGGKPPFFGSSLTNNSKPSEGGQLDTATARWANTEPFREEQGT
jgi:hypothetical protein